MRTPFFSSSKSSSTSSHNSSSLSTSSSHTFCESLLEETIENSQSIIEKWDLHTSSASTSASTSYNRVANLFRDNPIEAKQLLKSVNDLQHVMQFVIKDSWNSKLLVRAHNLMKIGINRVQKEFYTILAGSSYFFELSKKEVDQHNEITQTQITSRFIMGDLKAIADCMIGAGYGRECVKIYELNRKGVIDETLYYMGIEKLSSSQVQKMDWELVEKKIKNWLISSKIAVNDLFRGERVLCDYVFSSSDNVRGLCFSEIAKEGVLTLFLFPEAVTKFKKLSPEKMFRVLDLYDVVSELWVELETIFSFDEMGVVKSRAMALLGKLGDAVRAMLSDFERAMLSDSSKGVVPGGGVHPLTRYVMNYLVFLGDYSGSLSEIIVDYSPVSVQMVGPEYSCCLSPTSGDGDSPSPAIVTRFVWLVLVLMCKLDGKAKLYKDVALSYLFLANNLNYVILKVRESDLKILLGPEWISKHEMKVKEYVSKYERTGWSKVVEAIPENLTSQILSTEVLKECFKKFNLSFAEVYRKQSSWFIPDSKLRDHVKISLASKIVPIYRAFYEMYGEDSVGSTTGTESIVRFAPDDLQNYLSDLFHGASVSDGSYSPSISTSISSSSSQGR